MQDELPLGPDGKPLTSDELRRIAAHGKQLLHSLWVDTIPGESGPLNIDDISTPQTTASERSEGSDSASQSPPEHLEPNYAASGPRGMNGAFLEDEQEPYGEPEGPMDMQRHPARHPHIEDELRVGAHDAYGTGFLGWQLTDKVQRREHQLALLLRERKDMVAEIQHLREYKQQAMASSKVVGKLREQILVIRQKLPIPTDAELQQLFGLPGGSYLRSYYCDDGIVYLFQDQFCFLADRRMCVSLYGQPDGPISFPLRNIVSVEPTKQFLIWDNALTITLNCGTQYDFIGVQKRADLIKDLRKLAKTQGHYIRKVKP